MIELRKGLWICIEGADFTGKDTQVSLLKERLESLGNSVHGTHEPTERAREIHQRLERTGSPYEDGKRMAELYIADRVQNEREIILPFLGNGGVVIANRGKYSTDAYQSAQGIPLRKLKKMQEGAGVGTPDLTLFLEISEDELRRRISAKSERSDRFESDFDFQRKVGGLYKRFESLAVFDSKYYGAIFGIDAVGKIDEVADRVWEVVKPFYDFWKMKEEINRE